VGIRDLPIWTPVAREKRYTFFYNGVCCNLLKNVISLKRKFLWRTTSSLQLRRDGTVAERLASYHRVATATQCWPHQTLRVPDSSRFVLDPRSPNPSRPLPSPRHPRVSVDCLLLTESQIKFSSVRDFVAWISFDQDSHNGAAAHSLDGTEMCSVFRRIGDATRTDCEVYLQRSKSYRVQCSRLLHHPLLLGLWLGLRLGLS